MGIMLALPLGCLALSHVANGNPISENAAMEQPCTCGNGKLKLWGPGGPHTALLEPAVIFNERTAALDADSNIQLKEVEICWGPEDTWRSSAMECAGGLFSAAQQQMSGFLHVYDQIVDERSVTPITSHISTILVNKGNPKGITGIDDLFNPNLDIKLVVVDGNYHDTLSSATGLWEDVVGRSFDVATMKTVRDKISYFASGSGDARNNMLVRHPEFQTNADAWITWNDWAIANPDIFEEVPIDVQYVIARDISIVATRFTSESDTNTFQEFSKLLQSDDADVDAAMQDAGFQKVWNLSSP